MLGWEAQIQIQELSDLISLGEKVCSAVNKAKSFKGECSEVVKMVNQLSQMMKTLLCCIRSARAPLYLHPLRCILAKVKRHFELALAVVHKCKRRNLFWRLFGSGTQFRELRNRLYASIEDMKWLLSIYVGGRRESPCKESPRYRVWSCIAAVKMERELEDRIKAVDSLAFLAREKTSIRTLFMKKIKVANTLCLLANEKGKEAVIMKEMVSTILNRLSRTSQIWDRIEAADLVASIAEHYPEMKEYHLIRENVIWRLVSLLSSANDRTPSSLKLQLKLGCSRALLILVRESVRNCWTFAETKGMLCLAKLLGTEKNELQYNCLMIIREITAIAESDDDFRHSTFKSSSPASNVIVDELLRVIEEYDITKLRIPAIESVGSLARSFSVKESRVISPLVVLLGDTDREIAIKASIALQKFVTSTNHLCCEHSKSIIEFNGVPLLMKLILDDGDKELQSHGLTLLCRIAIAIGNDGESDVLINAGALNALRTTGRAVADEDSELKALVSEAISKLQSNNTEKHEESDNSPGIKQCIAEQSKAFFEFMRRQSKILLQGLIYLPEIVNLLQRSCKKGISRAKRSLKKRRIRRLKKSKRVELSPTRRLVMDSWMEEIEGKLTVTKKIFKSMEKKEIRRRFGFIIHKIRNDF
ncbi:Detected protein of unknown function [Hibiscus syriacus]|uniref:DUF7792 domain-containing protein n=1 Tax=Hibiscus syriacus TaxID=106335 RepID=A0A6A3CIA0_HIBSY|nr:uncharacterized protein LOC120199890 [Hibiscus syriacus]KAE8727242.1 Detected protein of unknown function [Hibiscus syriacus]